MTPVDLTALYGALRERVAVHAPSACSEISLALSSDFDDEVAFYRLVFWAYVLVNEAAKIPLSFLTSLPPLRISNPLRNETSRLRTFLAHNLDAHSKGDRRTIAFVQRWFVEACGHDRPGNNAQYGACCIHLGARLQEILRGAIEASHLLDDPDDGVRLVADLKGRTDVLWEAHRFDSIVSECASRLGDPYLDMQVFRSRNLDSWQKVLSGAPEHAREQAVRQRIEADLVAAIGEGLPRRLREKVDQVAASPTTLAAALVFLSTAQRIDAMSVQEIIERVTSQLQRPSSADGSQGSGGQ